MREIKIELSVQAINPKAFVVTSQDGATTLFSYGAPVVHRGADGKGYIDAIAWGRSKSTSGHIKQFTGDDKEAVTKQILSGEIELVRLVATNVSWNAPIMPEVKPASPSQAEPVEVAGSGGVAAE